MEIAQWVQKGIIAVDMMYGITYYCKEYDADNKYTSREEKV